MNRMETSTNRPLLWTLHVTAALLCVVMGAGFALWQYRELAKDRQASELVLRGQAESVLRAISGNLRSHRRLGAYFDQQIAVFLEELVVSQDVLGVSIFDDSGREVIHAGKAVPALPSQQSEGWSSDGYVSRREIEVPPLSSPGSGPLGRGRGFGRGGWGQPGTSQESVFVKGGRFSCAIKLDRSRFDLQTARMARLRWGLIVAGIGLCASLWGGWLLAVRMVVLSHRKRLAELQSRHWEELSLAAAGLAHETRNPLGSIRGWAQRLATSTEASASVASQARVIMEECDRITARINQFLSFARPYNIHAQAVDVPTMFAELTALLGADADARDLRVEARGEVPEVVGDPNLLRQALFNLLHNALRYSPKGGTIELQAYQDSPRRTVIEVRDRGPGVPEAARAKLFTPYYTTSDGTGLGLAIVRRIAEVHGWGVEYRPRDGGGAVFRLLIPVSRTKPPSSVASSHEKIAPSSVERAAKRGE